MIRHEVRIGLVICFVYVVVDLQEFRLYISERY